jgi:hypothetical protein
MGPKRIRPIDAAHSRPFRNRVDVAHILEKSGKNALDTHLKTGT